jgi:tetratricopeptide (TPR) repeat protein
VVRNASVENPEKVETSYLAGPPVASAPAKPAIATATPSQTPGFAKRPSTPAPAQAELDPKPELEAAKYTGPKSETKPIAKSAKVEIAKAEPPKPVPAKPVVAAALPKATTAEGHNQRGRLLTKSGDYPGAVQELTEAIKMKPDFAAAYNARAYTYILMRQYPKAIEDLNQAIRINPSYVNAFQNRASAKRMAGDVAGANQDSEQVKKLGGVAKN